MALLVEADLSVLLLQIGQIWMKNRAVETFRLSMFRWFCVQTWHIMRVYPFRLIWNQEGNGNPLQYSCLANPMDGGAWWAAVRAVAKSWTGLNDFTFIFHFHALEKEMATHSSVLAWRIPGTGEPGGLPSMGSHRVRHDWSDLAAAYSSYARKIVNAYSSYI